MQISRSAAETPRPVGSPPSFRRFSLAAAALFGLALASIVALRTWPPMPAVLALEVAFPPAENGRIEPIIATGEFANADFLSVKYETGNRVVIAYDAWGVGGPVSEPIPYIPGERLRLVVEMPSFTELNGVSTRPTAPLRVSVAGREILRGEVSFHRRKSHEIFFGLNPLGGTPAGAFRGTLWIDHRPVKGGPESYFSLPRRLAAFALQFERIAAVVLLGAAFGFFLPACQRWLRARPQQAVADAPHRPPHRWFICATVLATLVFTHVITAGTYQLFYPESFGTFYDYQALSLIHGRLDVAGEALSGEAFIYNGKCYGYFGPTPALLRIPFALLGVGFGLLSRPMMVLQFVACLAAVYAILCQAVRLRSGAAAWPSRFATLAFVLTAGLGSTLFFLSSRAYIYHEAILCGAAFGLWACYGALRYLDAPASRWWITALICGVLAVHARPPLGLYALVLIGVVAAMHLCFRRTKDAASARQPLKHLTVGALAVAGVLSFNGLSYLKFHTIEGCPLRYNVQYNATRLARIDGKQFHLGNVPFGFDAYLGKLTLKTTKHFPYFATHGLDSSTYPSAKIDMTESMAGIPWAMPGLSALALLGLFAWSRRSGALRFEVAAIWVAVLPTAFAMFAAIAVSHRYTGDFVPFLLCAAALGMAVVDRWAGITGRLTHWILLLLCTVSIAITAALTLSYQGEGVWGVPAETQQQYQRLRERVDGFFGNRS
ncbi:hypothetical protein [Opitutus sp. ER46]|uniref:hypothetical protein n=1 Tax=Opitutus sp. ER46 TaxID=2161864 RepID=UPI000D2F6CC9|nr:hypothetical protein [Opitutus sp. ER46]PTX92603.1 hypothetical protein DB354_14855 [Opitutus sp. ER46]